jgi:GntR family transcriptional regulator / MocR family aminotransferase
MEFANSRAITVGAVLASRLAPCFRKPHGMQIPILLDRSQAKSLTTQLAGQLRRAVQHKLIAPGARMPSSRRLAEQLALSRNTVVRAYEILIAEGYIEARAASGLYACMRSPDSPIDLAAARELESSLGTRAAMPVPRDVPNVPDLVGNHRNRLAFDFFPGRPNAGLFPLKTWRRLLNAAIAHGGAMGLTQYSEPAGLITLRTAIASHITATRGIVAEEGRIVVVGGIQEGLNLAARLLLSSGAVGAVENPCYQGAMFAFAVTGATIESINVDEEGLMPEDLARVRASLFYVTPSHQYPTGATLSLERRHAVVTWARRVGCYVLEDDYDSDFRYEGSPLPAIAATAPDCTIYLGTFSKSLGAGLRLGYMVVPPHLAEHFRKAKALLNNGNAWLDQAVLAEMINSGSYAAHLARIRTSYRERRDALIASIRRNFGDTDVRGTSAGLHAFWMLPPGIPDTTAVEEIGRRARVGVYAFASGGAYDAKATLFARRGLILGYAALQPRQIEQGIARLSQALDDALETHGPSFGVALPATDGRHARELAPNVPRRPALSARARNRALSKLKQSNENGLPMPVVSGIYRYPIKGLSAQLVSRIGLEISEPFSHDRVFGLARPGSPMDPKAPKWAKKGLFVMLMLEEALARVQTRLDVDTLELKVFQGNQELLSANLNHERGREAVERFIHELVPTLRAPPRLVRAVGSGHFMDKPDNVISLINLATVRSLEEQWGVEIDPLRFRANIYIDGAKPWEEFDWIGRDIVLGGSVLRVDRRNGRCGATNVNPLTGRRDLDIPGSLRAAFGHKDLGVYLIVRQAGSVAIGDHLLAPDVAGNPQASRPAAAGMPQSRKRYICRGCYYIYDEAAGVRQQGVAPGTTFVDLPSNWACPDCGTDKETFRPYVQPD